jgi:hypothetical protein
MSKPKTITVTRTSTITFDVERTGKQYQYDHDAEPDYLDILDLIMDGAKDFFSEYSGGEITYTDEHNNVLTMEA